MPSRLPPALTFGLRAALVAAVLCLGSLPAQAATEHYVIDKGHSSVLFRIQHLGVSYTHGRFNDFNGAFSVNDADLSQASVEIDISTESVDTNNEERDKHLRNKDFFDVENHPSMGFKSTRIEKGGEGVYRVTGNLTLLGTTRPVTIRMQKIGEADDPWGNHRVGFDSQVVIKRSEFGMKHMIPMIGDEVYVTLGIEGIRKK